MRIALLSLAFSLSSLAAVPAAPPHYSLVRRLPVGGEGFWDYLTFDAQGHRLFVSRQDRVIVVSADTGAQLGVIPNTEGVHGIALAPKLGRGFVSDGKANAVTVFDLKTLKRQQDLPVTGENPDAIVFEPKHERVLTMNGRSKNATVIDAKTLKVVATLALPGKPEFAVADGRGHVFANLEDLAHLVEIDVATPKVIADWDLKPCEGPSGFALDARHHRLFSVCDNQRMVVVDDRSGKIVAELPIVNGPDASLFDARRGPRRDAHRRPRGIAGPVQGGADSRDPEERAHRGARPEERANLPLGGAAGGAARADARASASAPNDEAEQLHPPRHRASEVGTRRNRAVRRDRARSGCAARQRLRWKRRVGGSTRRGARAVSAG